MRRDDRRPKHGQPATQGPALAIRPGDVVEYRDGAALALVVGTVYGTPTPRTLELYCGSWVPRDSVVRVIRHVNGTPTPSSIATAMMRGMVHGAGTP